MKELFEQVIQRREYDLKSLLTCIDQYHIEGKLTDEERQELTQKARDGAAQEYDYKGEIDALWGGGTSTATEHLAARRGRMARIRAAHRRGNGLSGGRQGYLQGSSLCLPSAALRMESGGLSHRMAETGMSDCLCGRSFFNATKQTEDY